MPGEGTLALSFLVCKHQSASSLLINLYTVVGWLAGPYYYFVIRWWYQKRPGVAGRGRWGGRVSNPAGARLYLRRIWRHRRRRLGWAWLE
jgi:hypothetical protein